SHPVPPGIYSLSYTTLFRSFRVVDVVRRRAGTDHGAHEVAVLTSLVNGGDFHEEDYIGGPAGHAGTLTGHACAGRIQVAQYPPRSEEHRLNSSHVKISYAVF